MKFVRQNTTKFFYLILSINMFLMLSSVHAKEDSLYDISFRDLEGEELQLNEFAYNLILVVNTASFCGFTKQYGSLQILWENYKSKGLKILALPSNDFNQEPGESKDIKEFCEVNYGITFPVMSKVKIRGKNKHPFFLWIENNYGLDKLPKWNFFKYLITKEGKLVKVFSSRIKPDSSTFIEEIEKYL